MPSVSTLRPTLRPQDFQSVADMRAAADQTDIARRRMATEEDRAAASEAMGTARLGLDVQREQRLAAEPTWQQRLEAETIARAFAGEYTGELANERALALEEAKRGLPPTAQEQSLIDYRSAMARRAEAGGALPSMASFSPLSRVQAAQIARSMGVPADQIAEITGVTIPTGVPGFLARIAEAFQGSERYMRGYKTGRTAAGGTKPKGASTAQINALKDLALYGEDDVTRQAAERKLNQILGLGTGTQDEYVTGKVYEDAEGRRARYLGNGKWEQL